MLTVSLNERGKQNGKHINAVSENEYKQVRTLRVSHPPRLPVFDKVSRGTRRTLHQSKWCGPGVNFAVIGAASVVRGRERESTSDI